MLSSTELASKEHKGTWSFTGLGFNLYYKVYQLLNNIYVNYLANLLFKQAFGSRETGTNHFNPQLYNLNR